MADFTRFDLYAKDFMHSEHVQSMNVEEIGQYFLLLCNAWLIGKDTTLPDDPTFLANLCRGKEVSPKVLKMFPVVQELGRRRNERLYKEWQDAKQRTIDAKKAVDQRAYRPTLGNRQSNVNRSIGEVSEVDQSQIRSVSDQIIPESDRKETASFKNIATHYASFFGIAHSHARKHIEKYQAMCAQYGEQAVLDTFDTWAPQAAWLKEKRDPHGLNIFYPAMVTLISGAELRKSRETKEPPKPKGVQTSTNLKDYPEAQA